MKPILAQILVFVGIALPSILFVIGAVVFISKRNKEGFEVWKIARDTSAFFGIITLAVVVVGFLFRRIQFASESKFLVSMSNILGFGFYVLVAVVGVSLICSLVVFAATYLLKSKSGQSVLH